jgi:virginiamycin A acetyltransferase
MSARDLIPDCLKAYFKLLARKRQFRDSMISSHLVSPNCEIGRCCMISRDVEVGPGVAIGDYSYVNAGTIIGSGVIKKYCSIGYFCQIGLPEHPLSLLSTSPHIYGAKNIFGKGALWADPSRPPEIGNDVWIASHVVVVRDVKIGDGAVVGAGSVVTRDIAPYTICVGVPARPIRKRFTTEQVDSLLRWQWWDRPHEELAQAWGELLDATARDCVPSCPDEANQL